MENFEDPAQETPYDSGEGGFLYIHGGPYEADDVIGNVFADIASQEIIQAAIEAIELEGFEWAPSGHRIQPPDDDDDRPRPPEFDLSTLHARMLARLGALEEAVEKIKSPSMGHNHPPEPLVEEPLAAADFQAITSAVSVLKIQPIEPAEVPAEAIEAASTLQRIATKTAAYFAQKGDVFVTEAVKTFTPPARSPSIRRLVKTPDAS